ncbi:MAG: hypothetical protein PUC50_04065 [Bacteroidales bacterium]|nr:hypothetical protein [Bacteroidales bacterium]
MKKKIILLAAAIAGLTSIASAQKTTTVLEVNVTEARTTDAVTRVHARPIICDIKMKTYQQGADWCRESDFNLIDKSTNRFTDFWFLTSSDINAFISNDGKTTMDELTGQLRSYGMFRSQQYHKCDVVIAPIFNWRSASKDEKQQRGADYVVTISGYAADFVNFKNASDEDLNLIIKNDNIGSRGYGSNGLIPIMSNAKPTDFTIHGKTE